MARVGALLPEHEALGPLADVLVWAAAPDPAERYDAARLGRELSALSATLPPPAPLPLVTIPDDRAGQTQSPTAGHVRRSPLDSAVRDRTELGTPDADTASGRPKRRDRSRAVARDPSRARRRWLVAIAALVPLLIAGGVAWGLETGVFTPSHPVPPLVGKTLAVASAAAAPDHFTVRTGGPPTLDHRARRDHSEPAASDDPGRQDGDR